MALPLSLRQHGEVPSLAEDSGRGNKNALKAKRYRLTGARAVRRTWLETERNLLEGRERMVSIEVDYRYSQDQLEALFRQAREEDVEHGGRFDTGSAALNIWTHPWNNPAMRDESSLMGTFYAAWAEKIACGRSKSRKGFRWMICSRCWGSWK
jgi:hypothetical protein